MKKALLFILSLSFSITYSQNILEENDQIAEAERKAGANLMHFRANENTANYDITYHRLEFAVDPANQFIAGNVTTYFIAREDLGTVTFDLNNSLTVSSVTQRGNSLSFAQNSNKELVIALPVPQSVNALDSLSISYSGIPSTAEGAFTTYMHSGTPGFYTLSEPYGARDWWPCKQDLNDKIDTIDVFLTTPSQYVGVANGVELGVVNNGNGTKTTHFRHSYPIPAYLIAIAATNYSVYTQQAGTAPDTFPIVNYIYPENQAATQNNLAVTLPIMDLFENLFETYPFAAEKYGHAQCSLGGGMEHTTVSFMGSFGRNLIAHELAHQWFGDKITCGSWNDIWLNEGFATYLSGLVVENLDNPSAFIAWKQSLVDNITSSPSGAVYLTEADIQSVARIFNSRLTYNKAAMVVHMLRYKLGDAAFFQGMKNYLADPLLAYGYAVTEDLKRHLETVSGTDLDEFFNDWVYNEGYPTYFISAQTLPSGQVRFEINQTQSHASVSFFEMPVTVRVFGASGEQLDVVLEHTSNGQVFIETVPFALHGLVFDPNADIISRNSTATLGTESFSLLEAAKLYPNPVSQVLNLELPGGVVVEKTVFYNMLGQVIKESGSAVSWNVSELPAGINFVKIHTDNGIKTLPFLKN